MRCFIRSFLISLRCLITAILVLCLAGQQARAALVNILTYSDNPAAENQVLIDLPGNPFTATFTNDASLIEFILGPKNVFFGGSVYGTDLDASGPKTAIQNFISAGDHAVAGNAGVAGVIDWLPSGLGATVDSASSPGSGFTLTAAGLGHPIFSGLSALDLGSNPEDTILTSSLGANWTVLATSTANPNAVGLAIGTNGSGAGRMLLWPDRLEGTGRPTDGLIENAFDFLVNGTIAATPVLTTSPVAGSTIAFGNVRLGTTTAASSITASNSTGAATSTLTGSFPAAPGEFSPGSALAFGPLETTDTAASRDYTYSPTNRVADDSDITVTSDGGNSVITLTGDGVGPQFESTGDVANELNFGLVNVGDMSSIMQLTITNNSPDGDLGNLTDLSLLAGVLAGANSDQFTVTGYSNQVLGTSDFLIIDFKFVPTSSGGKTATFTFDTDQAAVFGLSGDEFVFTLTGNVISTGGEVPEPSSLVLISLGVLFVLRRRRR